MKIITHAEFLDEGKRRFGSNWREWKFVCPACGTIQTAQQLLDAGLSDPEVHSVVAYSCLGRFTNQGSLGISEHTAGRPWDKGCDWTLGGLFHIHTLEVIMPSGNKRPIFEFAEPAAPNANG